MKVLVAGAAGQVGCRLVRQLLDQNHEVRGTVLPDDPAMDRLAGLDIEFAKGDLTDETFVREAINGVDAVIHTANFVGPQFDNNLQINRLISQICGENADRLERLVYTSSSGVFPNNGESITCAYHPVDELHPKQPFHTLLFEWNHIKVRYHEEKERKKKRDQRSEQDSQANEPDQHTEIHRIAAEPKRP